MTLALGLGGATVWSRSTSTATDAVPTASVPAASAITPPPTTRRSPTPAELADLTRDVMGRFNVEVVSTRVAYSAFALPYLHEGPFICALFRGKNVGTHDAMATRLDFRAVNPNGLIIPFPAGSVSSTPPSGYIAGKSDPYPDGGYVVPGASIDIEACFDTGGVKGVYRIDYNPTMTWIVSSWNVTFG